MEKKIGAVRIRPATEGDISFIFSSWLKSYRESHFGSIIPTTIFYTEHHKVVERLLKGCQTFVACNDNDLNELYGFICAEQVDGIFVLHFVYVKHTFRMLGIGRQLLNAFEHDPSKASMYTHHTKAAPTLSKKYRMIHSPYLALTPDYRAEQATKLTQAEKKEYYGEDDK